MTEQVKVDLVLDLKGLLCPMPIVKLSQAIKDLPVGAVIEGIATDPGVMADVPAWAKTSGQELISIEQRDKEYRFLNFLLLQEKLLPQLAAKPGVLICLVLIPSLPYSFDMGQV